MGRVKIRLWDGNEFVVNWKWEGRLMVSEEGRAQMSFRVWEGIRQGEYEFHRSAQERPRKRNGAALCCAPSDSGCGWLRT